MLASVDSPVKLSLRESIVWYWRFLHDPIQTLVRSRDRYGPFFQLPHVRPPQKRRRLFLVAIGANFNRVVLGNPEAWRPVDISPGGAKNSAARRLGKGIIRSTGRGHQHYRRMLVPPLQRKNIDLKGPMLARLAEEEIGAWQVDRAIDLWALVRRLMRTFAIGILFANDREHGFPIADMINQGTNYNWSWKVVACPLNLPGTPYYQMERDARMLEQRIIEWARCKRGALDDQDLLSIVTNNPDENGMPASEASIVGHTPTLFGAAYETCQNALIWTLILLDQHPTISRDLYDELQGQRNGAVPDYDVLMRLPLLDAIVKESMRILPPVPQQFRVAQQDTTLGDYPVPKRTRVLLSPFVTNREPAIYPEPECFKPERWASINPSPNEYSVFSAGPRGCPGYAFATAMLKVAVATVMSRYRIVLTPGTSIDYKVRIALSPASSVSAVLHPQDGAFAASRIQGKIRELVRFPN